MSRANVASRQTNKRRYRDEVNWLKNSECQLWCGRVAYGAATGHGTPRFRCLFRSELTELTSKLCGIRTELRNSRSYLPTRNVLALPFGECSCGRYSQMASQWRDNITEPKFRVTRLLKAMKRAFKFEPTSRDCQSLARAFRVSSDLD